MRVKLHGFCEAPKSMHSIMPTAGHRRIAFALQQQSAFNTSNPVHRTFLPVLFIIFLFSSPPFAGSSPLQHPRHNRVPFTNVQGEGADSTGVPKVLVQYGPPRTATTLQFQILCAIAVLLRNKGSETVHCDYRLSADAFQMVTRNIQTWIVVKYHDVDTALERMSAIQLRKSSWNDAWLFTTSTRTASQQHRSVLSNGARSQKIKYQQNYSRVLEVGSQIAKDDYAPLFGLSPSEANVLSAYIHDWDVLRMCCGAQMTKAYRRVLWWEGQVAAAGSDRGSARSIPLHKCEGYNISNAEVRLVGSRIFQLGSDLSRIRQLSSRDGVFSGNYCKSANQLISEKKLKHNSFMHGRPEIEIHKTKRMTESGYAKLQRGTKQRIAKKSLQMTMSGASEGQQRVGGSAAADDDDDDD